eukprot:TRINITY_DN3931_c0_g1_i2.p2 TRINITY_DN3931_c0_g1~~TRINITY_DN3931_c0_g1_i2.p2  ORF type:complete len:125 (-),score=25.01 TRINITY_DN3931_c0_g1_i2:391-765(-)
MKTDPSIKQGLLGADEKEEEALRQLDAKMADKQKRLDLEAAALEEMQADAAASSAGSSKARFQNYKPPPSKSTEMGAQKQKRSSLSKWLSCFKVPTALLSHTGPKNTSCAKTNGTTKRLRRLWK